MRWGYRRPPVLPLLATAAFACSPSPLAGPLTRLGRVTTGSSSGLSFGLTSGSATGSTSGGVATGSATSGGAATAGAGATGTGVAATTGAVGGATASGATSSGQGAGSSGSTSGGTTTTGGNGATCGCPAVKYCDPIGTPRCLDCLTDADCASGTVCQASDQYFQYGQCVACDEAEPTCPGTEVCFLSLGASYHQCVADCRLATGAPPCPGATIGRPSHCDAATGTCAPGCALATDCTAYDALCDLDSGIGCTPPTELCALDAGSCVQCRWAADCTYSNPGCSYGYCGACVDDTGCPPGLACGGTVCGCPDGGGCGGNAPVCILDTWCGCQSSADCAPQESVCASGGFAGVCLSPCFDGGTDCSVQGQFCDFDSGLCGPCRYDSQCTGNPLGPYCIGPGCGCLSTKDCAASSVCDGRSECIASCTIDGGADCASSGQFCYPDSGLCGACESDSQCVGYDAGPLCLPSLGSCGCASTSDCGPNGGCEPGTSQCVLSCLLDDGGACAKAELACDPGSRVCVTCIDDSTCTPLFPYCANDVDAGTVCVECVMPSQCPDSRPGCDQVGLSCGSCTSSADCPATLPLCQDQFCSPSCVLADGGTYCSTGLCQIATGLCVQCLQDSDCKDPGALFCSPAPYAGNCVQCAQDSDCADGGPCNSQYFYCGGCAADSDCPVDAPICIGAPIGACSDGGS